MSQNPWGKIVKFDQRPRSPWRRLSLGWALPWVPVVALVGVVSIVENFKFSPASLFHELSSAPVAPTTIKPEGGAHTISGLASVIDGDTIEIHGIRIRLFGIDAPEGDQFCTVKGKTSRCGQLAALALADEIANKVVSCQPKDRDHYGRLVAVCLVGDNDINAWMVANGWALAYRRYSHDYINEEAHASKSKIGIWQGEFIPPWDWRHDNRVQRANLQQSENKASNAAASDRCVIKGNISRNGERIYHVPSGEHYSKTIINVGEGERWFCSEAEAQAAGWRRSHR